MAESTHDVQLPPAELPLSCACVALGAVQTETSICVVGNVTSITTHSESAVRLFVIESVRTRIASRFDATHSPICATAIS
jgi:hypothetical protein